MTWTQEQLDLAQIGQGKLLAEIVEGVSPKDLAEVVNSLFDQVDEIVKDLRDADVVFVAKDPANTEDNESVWTIGHVVVHVTAGLEEGAAAASTLARGVALTERLRFEVPWEQVATAGQVHQRLAESQRMVNAFLQTFPDEPNLEVTVTRVPRFGPMNAIASLWLVLMHGYGHRAQLREILRQARAA